MIQKKYKILIIGFLTVFLIVEICLRLFLGIGNPPIYIEDKDFEYIYAPNQNIKRFGNNISTNEYSMKSAPVSDSDYVRILKIGDSIINGGSQIGNDSLASNILEKELSLTFKKKIRVLNISSGSWGPDNAFAYIKKHGDFNSKFFILVFSSHDLYDTMGHEKIVGTLSSFPSKKPLLAITELWNRYIFPWLEYKTGFKIKNNKINADTLLISYKRDKINPGWNNFFDYTRTKNIKLLIVLHPTIHEIEKGAYDSSGKKLIAMFDSVQINYILELKNKLSHNLYRDDIHYNNKGQRKLASEIYPYIKQYIEINNH